MKKKRKALGGIAHISMELESPMKFGTGEPMSLNGIMILVGPNGTGKTMLLRLIWCVNMYVHTRTVTGHAPDFIKSILDNAVPDHEIDGNITIEYTSGCSISMTFIKGKVDSIMDDMQNITDSTMPIFLSKDTRQFNFYRQYIKTKKMIGIGDIMSANKTQLEQLSDMYKSYDVQVMEIFLNKIKEGWEVPEQLEKVLLGYDPEFVVKSIRLVGDKIEVENDKGFKDITNYGAGHQALLAMHPLQFMMNE